MHSNAGALEREFNLVTRERHEMHSNAGALEREKIGFNPAHPLIRLILFKAF